MGLDEGFLLRTRVAPLVGLKNEESTSVCVQGSRRKDPLNPDPTTLRVGADWAEHVQQTSGLGETIKSSLSSSIASPLRGKGRRKCHSTLQSFHGNPRSHYNFVLDRSKLEGLESLLILDTSISLARPSLQPLDCCSSEGPREWKGGCCVMSEVSQLR